MYTLILIALFCFAFCLGYIFGFRKGPRFKPGDTVQYGPVRAKVVHVGWSDFHSQWTYYLSHDDWYGYILAKDLKKCS